MILQLTSGFPATILLESTVGNSRVIYDLIIEDDRWKERMANLNSL